jgi:hypothetical protein
MIAAPDPSRRGDSGFVLIGVVIFVLALTIIGMSLYSLSSYEAQFLQRSQDGEQAFQSAVGGLERVKYVLSTSPYRMDRVKQSLPADLVAATAIQVQGGLPDSTSPVVWGGGDVFLSVTAQVGQEQRSIRGFFRPRLRQQAYTQLLATNGGIVVEPENPPGVDRRYTVHLAGSVWQGTVPPDPSTWTSVLGSGPALTIATDPVPLPQVPQYLSSYLGPAPQSPDPDPGPGPFPPWRVYPLFAGIGNVAFFKTPPSMVGNSDFSLYDSQTVKDVMLGVSGCAVWLMPQGIRFDRKVRVVGWSGTPQTDCLIIVAGQSGSMAYNDPEAGIWFNDGLQTDGTPVILVTNGRVRIQHNTSGDDSYVSEITIYAGDVLLTGPDVSSGRQMWLNHTSGAELDTYWVPRLADAGDLPNLTSTSGRELALVMGTWRVTGR